MKPIDGYREALHDGGIPDMDARIDKMLSLANVDKNGNSKVGLLTMQQVKDCILTIGGELDINSLYKRKSVFTLDTPPLKEKQSFYEECLKSVAKPPRQQFSNKDSPFL